MKIPENNDYLKGTKPFSWNGSIPILQQWYNGRCRPVRYGYCGSLASVMCTGIFQPAFTYLSKMGERKLGSENSDPQNYCKHTIHKRFTKNEIEYFFFLWYGMDAFVVFIINLLLSYKLWRLKKVILSFLGPLCKVTHYCIFY